ncbi:2411_t:CDS:1 [Ambispora gerdemannii]|uniref:2411_t:CDS:1 n=1 Tax=Ambispora gerdemannii TaxID=144530 RepID=A0A9N9ADK0_9GLOM|nr:2411_t:CDS:1 [Ambispora gerdemannii]
MNLYDYEEREAILNGKSKVDKLSGEYLNNQQTIFRRYDYTTGQTTYFYRTNESLVGHATKPVLIKKNYRLGTRSLNPLNLLKLADKPKQKEIYSFKKPKQQLKQDFQEFLITRLLLLCKSAEFTHIPLEKEHVPKELEKCDQSITNHFQTKPVLRFTFLPQQASLIRTFMEKLDTYAQEYDMEESKDFSAPCFTDPIASRNAYLNN